MEKNKITKLEYQKTSHRVTVYLDGRFAFGLRTEVALDERLHIDQQIAEPDIKRLLGKSVYMDLYDGTLRVLSIRPRSIYEMRTYLQQRLYTVKNKAFRGSTALHYEDVLPELASLINQIVDNLIQKQYLDDQKFAHWWISQRLASKPRGKYALQAELQAKGVDKHTIEEVLSSMSELSYENTNLTIRRVLEKVGKSISGRGYNKQKAKEVLTRRLLSKGFSWEEIASQIDEYLSKQYN